MRADISRFWYQRLAEGTVAIGAFIVLFFGLGMTIGNASWQNVIPSWVAAVAIIPMALGIVARLRPFADRGLGADILVGSLCITIFALIVATGGLSSPFIGLWLPLGLVSGMIGLVGIVFVLWAMVLYIAVELLLGWWAGPTGRLATLFLAGLLPIGVSFFLWYIRFFSGVHRKDELSHLTEQLAREAGKSAIIINAIADGVMVISRKGQVQLINPAAQHLTGWEQKDAIDLDYHSILKLTTELDKPLVNDDPIQQVLKTNKPVVSNNLTLTTHAGKKVLLSLVVSPVSSGKEAAAVIAVFRDITDEKAEEREKAEFISTASHEMRTPVASIEGYLALAMNPQVAVIDDKARDYLLKAHEATKHLGRLFQDLLTISRAEDGRLKNEPQLIDVVAFVQKLWEGQRPKAEAKQLQYSFLPGQGSSGTMAKMVRPIFYASIDPDRLSEVVNNLIDNAIKYTPQGQVVVDVTADAEKVIVSVRDSGVGIAKEDISHLFQKFYRVDNSYTRDVGGTGLGLYISRKIMEQSGGQLWVESEVGKGSAFFVQIPRIDSEKAAFLRQQLTPTIPAGGSNAGAPAVTATTPPNTATPPEGPAMPLQPRV